MPGDVDLPQPAPGTPAPAVVQEERARQMLAAKAAGATWQQIADEFGYATRQAAMRFVHSHTSRHLAAGIDAYRAVENEKLDMVEAELWPILQNDEHDVALRIRAADSINRLSARRSRLNGWDAPVKVDLSVGVRAELLDALAELRDLVEGEVVQAHDEPASP